MSNLVNALIFPPDLDNLLQSSEEIKIAANTRYLLNDPGSVWFVKKNNGDVYAWEYGNERFVPFFVKEATEGEIIFGLFSEKKDDAKGFFFITSKEASLYKVKLSALQNLLKESEEVRNWVAKVIDSWTGAFISHFSSEEETLSLKEFSISQDVTLLADEKATLYHALDPEKKHQLAWIECRRGEIEFAGDESFHLRENEMILLPLTSELWIKAIKDSSFFSYPTVEALLHANFWNGLTALQREFFHLIEIKKETDIKKALERIEKKKKLEQESKEAAIYSLGSVLEKKRFAATQEGNALCKACDLIGQILGVKIQQPPHSSKSTVDEQINEISLASGIFSRSIKLKAGWWQIADAPLLAFYGESKKPVALLNHSPNEFEFQDPDSKQNVKVTENNSRQFDQKAFAFHPSFFEEKITFFSLLKFAYRESYREGYLLVIVAILSGLVNLYLPYAMEELFDTLTATANTAVLTQLTLGLFLVAFSLWIFAIARRFSEERLSGISNIKLEMGLWGRILNLPTSFFRKFSAGELMNQFQSLVAVNSTVNDHVISVMFSSIYAFFYFVQMTTFSLYLTMVSFLGFFVAVFLFSCCSVLQINLLKKMTDLSGKIQGMVIQMIAGLPKIRVAGAESRFFRIWSDLFATKKNLYLRFQKIQMVTGLTTTLFPMIATVVIYAFAILLFQQDLKKSASLQGLTIGQFVGFSTAFGLFVAAAIDVLNTVFSGIRIFPLWKNAKPLVEQSIEKGLDKPAAPRLKGKMVIDHVSYRYDPDGDLTLKDVSLEVLPGEMMAIVGPSGSGKSTIVRLLLGFEKPENGAIYFDDKNLEELDPRTVRQQIGTVLQNASLISGSIYENIVGSGTFSAEVIEKAIYFSGFEEDLKNLPMGLNTVIPMGGGSFSGGQKQRLLLARALVASPSILLLDEATSALDNKTQDFVSVNLDKLRLTRIVIAHRLSTIKNADRIYVLEQGKVVQVGTFKELAAQEGLFSSMLKRQML